MRRALLLLLLVGGAARADQDNGDVLERALQTRIERAAGTVGPSSACIYVSRSDAYRKAPFWGSDERPDCAGRLGRFDAAAARKRVPADARNRERILRSINDHDLSAPAAVPESYGSGIVVDRSGLVLTNAHVVRNATKIHVRLSKNRSSWADILASDPRCDLAVLKLLDPPANLKALTLGDGGKVRTGQIILLMANSYTPRFRCEPTISAGLVSKLRVEAPGKENEWGQKKTLHEHGTLIQTDARTTPGCSGGALMDLDGKVVGLTTAVVGIRGDKPGGFAIPFDTNTRRIIEVLKRGEEVEYGFLGVGVSRQDRGVWVTNVAPGSPASRAGIQTGDHIVAIDGKPATRNDDLFLLIGMALAGNTVRVEVLRGTIRRSWSIKLAKFYVPGSVLAAKRPPARFGLRVDYTSIISQRNPFFGWRQAPADGVVIREVVPDSPADKARLQPDKLIIAVNGKAVTTPAEYYAEIARAGKKVELTYLDSRRHHARLTLQEK
jgi:serine protease Do